MITIDTIVAYEEGDLSANEIVDLFASLVKSGHAWTLQGRYGRTAQHFIDVGIISSLGKVLEYPE